MCCKIWGSHSSVESLVKKLSFCVNQVTERLYFYINKDTETEKLVNEYILLTFFNWFYFSEQRLWIQRVLVPFKEG
jgi:hypothetical protein